MSKDYMGEGSDGQGRMQKTKQRETMRQRMGGLDPDVVLPFLRERLRLGVWGRYAHLRLSPYAVSFTPY